MDFREIDIFHLEEAIWLGNKPAGVSAYDFLFEPLFHCRRPYELPSNKQLICRVGAFDDYETAYSQFNDIGFKLVNNVEEHRRASELSSWYPLIEQFTPRSKWYDEIPDIADIEQEFVYPVFVKGSRQTAKHKKSLSVANNTEQCGNILKEYQSNSILHWQQLVCREFVELKPVEAVQTEKVPPSFEFRSFWYKGVLVGVGHYWSEFIKYSWSKAEEIAALKVAREVSDIVDVPFLVVDLACMDFSSFASNLTQFLQVRLPTCIRSQFDTIFGYRTLMGYSHTDSQTLTRTLRFYAKSGFPSVGSTCLPSSNYSAIVVIFLLILIN